MTSQLSPNFLNMSLYLAHTCVLPFKIVRKLLQTWKYEDMKVLSTTTMMSLFFCLMTFTASAMSTILKVGLVGVSNQTSCQLKKHKQSLLNRKMCYQLSKNPQTTLDIYQMHRNYIMTYRYYCFVLLKYSCKLWLKLSNASKTTSSCFIKIPSYLVSWLFLHYRWQCSQQRRFPPPFWSPLVWKIC